MEEGNMFEVTEQAIGFLSEMLKQMGGVQKVRLAMMET